jgi:Zn-dependent membrane protease YugP/tetratricopeptide (TPR) repeat protein
MDSFDFLECFDEGSVSLLICIVGFLGAFLVHRAARNLGRTVAKHAGRIAHCGLSGRHVARRLLAACGLSHVKVAGGAKIDLYRPWRRAVHLTNPTFDNPTICSLAVAAHEVGHAQQFAEGFWPARLWRVGWPICYALPALLVVFLVAHFAGALDLSASAAFTALLAVPVVMILLQLPVHLPLERDASRRARQLVRREGLIEERELPAFDELLTAAWRTHVAMHAQRWILLVAAVAVVACVPSLLVPIGLDEQPINGASDAPVASPVVVPAPPAAAPPGVIPPHEFYQGDGIFFLGVLFPIVSAAVSFALLFLPLYLLSRVGRALKPKLTVEEQALKHNNAASELQAQRKWEEAVAEFTRAIELNPELTLAWHNRAVVQVLLGRIDAARSDLDAAIRLAPQFADALAGRGYVRSLQGDLDGALNDCNAALRIENESDEALSARGTVYLAQGKYDLAIGDFTAALQLAPNRGHLYRNRALAHCHLEQHEQAIADADRALQLEPRDALSLNNRAAASIKLGHYARALEDLAAAVQLDPEFPHPHKHIAWIRGTCPQHEFRDAQVAVAEATRALELIEWKEPKWFEVLAAAHAEAGNFAEAVRWQQKCIDESTTEQTPAMRSRLERYEAHQPYRVPPHATSPTHLSTKPTRVGPREE